MKVYLPDFMKILGVLSILCICSPVKAQHSNALARVSQPSISVVQPNQKSLRQILMLLETKYKVLLSFNDKHVEGKYVEATKLEGTSLEGILSTILPPLKLQFTKLDEEHYVIEANKELKKVEKLINRSPENVKESDKVKGKPFFPFQVTNTESRILEKTITGQVTDENSEPLPGVNIVVKGTTTGTVTDVNGNYRLSIPDEATTLVFSSVGYVTEEMEIGDRTVVNLQMAPDIQALSEVVVVGYGTQEKRDLTGAVSSVSEEDFTQGVNNSALQLLNGRASGVFVSQSSSAPGGDISVRVRGAGSINSSNEVLVVVDGLPGASTQALSPDDIESIEVLKDASAAAIYGTRAANGVILITTKKGKAGETQVNYDGYVGLQEAARQIEVLNGSQYMQVLNELLVAQGEAPKFTEAEIAAIGEGTNWQDEIFRTGLAQNHQLSLSGGSDRSKYYVGMNYFNQDGIVKGSNFTRYNLRFNNEITPGDRFKINLNLNVNRFIQRSILTTNVANEGAGPINTAIQFDPTLGTSLSEDGTYERNPTVNLENPLSLINGVDEEAIENRAYSTISADYELLPGFTATARLGIDIRNRRFDSYNSRLTTAGKSAGGIGSISTMENNHYLAEFLGTYKKTFGDVHNVTILGGITFEEFDNRNVGTSSRGFLSDVTGTDLLQSGDGDEGDNVSSGRNVNRLNSFLGRVNYTLLDRYLLTASVRADGTSRFAEGNKYAIFPSLAFAWRVSDEAFLANSSLLSNLKLRLGYGQLGNQGINNFETIQTFVASGAAVLGDGLIQGVAPARIPNTDLKWETTEEFNFGIDFGFFEGRLSGSLDYFIKTTKDQLFSRPVPTTTGFDNIRVNFGEVRNQGLELFLKSVNIDKALKWTTTLTMATLKNEVTELPDFIPEIISGGIGTFTSNFVIVREGEALRSFYGYEVLGIFQEEDDIANSAQPDALPGHPIYRDADSDGTITSDDRVILGKPLPGLTYGINNAFRYKNFGLDIFFIGVQGIDALDNNVLESFFPINFDRNRMAEHYLNRWTPENPDAPYPSGIDPSSYGGGRAVNSLTISDASFFRLKTVTLSYEVPVSNLRFLDRVSVYLAGDNLFTITDFLGYDPDANNGSGNSGTGTGVIKTSYNSYPLNRTFRFGAEIGF